MESPFPRRCSERFEAKKLLASGSFGSVFLARQLSLNRNAAVKLLNIDSERNPVALARFVREAKIAAKLRHAHILEILDQDFEDTVPWIAYEYLAGGSVDSLLREMGAMRWPDAARLAYQVATALACAHASGILHRDVKPANVLVAGPGSYKLGDFGIAHQLDATVLTQPGSLVGTLAYVAPEQALGQPVVPASDVYSLGVMLFELVTGQRVFADSTPANILSKHVHEPPRRPSELDPTLPAELDAVVLKALAKKVSDRYTTADAFALALAGLSSSCSGFDRPLDLSLLPGHGAPGASEPLATASLELAAVEETPKRTPAARRPVTPRIASTSGKASWPYAIPLGLGLAFVGAGAFIVGPALRARSAPSQTRSPAPPPTPTQQPAPTQQPTPVPPPPPEPPPGMVRIESGAFFMGHNEPGAEFHPEHEVVLGTYWIDRTEVSNAQFDAFCQATRHRPRAGMGRNEREFDLPNHPAMGVDWDDAMAYARWAGKRLPTEAEWEKAARGQDRRTYPWGDDVIAGQRLVNTGMDVFLTSLDDPYPYTSPVTEFTRGASPYGVLNMAGNVAEWCMDRWDRKYYEKSPRFDPRGPARSDMHVVRGGHWHEALEAARTFSRQGSSRASAGTEIGFRCAWSPARGK